MTKSWKGVLYLYESLSSRAGDIHVCLCVSTCLPRLFEAHRCARAGWPYLETVGAIYIGTHLYK